LQYFFHATGKLALKLIKLLQYSKELSHDVSEAEMFVNRELAVFTLMLNPHVTSRYDAQVNKRLKATAYEETQRKSKKVIAGRTEEYFIYWWWKEEGHVLRRFLDLTPTS
jgi:predicted Holliday junction resolvase-like endonuclease